MATPTTYRVGIIGAGDIAGYHMQGVKETPCAELGGVWNRTRARAEERAAEFGCPVFDTAEQLIADPSIHVVFVLTNVETHKHYALLAIQHGKHVLVEKPVAWTVEEMVAIRDAAAAAGVKCIPVHNELYDEGHSRLKEMIQSGRLGKVAAVHILYNIHHPDDVRARYPGVIRQTGTHQLYKALYLVGRPVRVSAMRNTVGSSDVAPQEDIAMITMQTPSGTLVHITTSFAADDHSTDNFTYLTKVIGTAGSARYSFSDFVENAKGMVHSHTYSAYPISIRNVGKFFLERVIARGEEPLSTLDDAIAIQRIEEAVYRSIETGAHVTVEY